MHSMRQFEVGSNEQKYRWIVSSVSCEQHVIIKMCPSHHFLLRKGLPTDDTGPAPSLLFMHAFHAILWVCFQQSLNILHRILRVH